MKKNIKSLLLLALPYIAIICLPIVSTLFLSHVVSENYHEKVLFEKQKSMESSYDRLLKKTESIEHLMYSVAKSSEMTEYISLIKSDKPITSKYMAVKEMMDSLMIDSNMLAMYYYDLGDQRLITNDASYSNAEAFFAIRYKTSEYTAEEYIERLGAMGRGQCYYPSLSAKLDYTNVEVIEYKMSLPLISGSTTRGHLVMLIDTKEFFREFIDVIGDGGEIYVYDRKNNLIYYNGEKYEGLLGLTDIGGVRELSFEDQTVFGMVCGSDSAPWKIKVYTTEVMIDEYIEGMSLSVLLWTVLPVVASVLLCMYFTIKKYRSICDILNMFKDHSMLEDNEVSYRHIREKIDHLMNANRDYQEQIGKTKKYELLDKLIRNTYSRGDNFTKELKDAELRIVNGRCVVLCIRYKSSESWSMVTDKISVRDFVKKILYQIIEKNVEIFDTSVCETTCILSLGEEDDIELIMPEILSAINVEIVYNYGIDIEIGIGNVVDSPLQLGDSYAQAQEVIQYNETSRNLIYMYSELKKMGDIYYYPVDFDDRVYNYLVTGKIEEAKKLICSVYHENMDTNKRISNHSLEVIKGRVHDSVLLLCERTDLPIDVTKNCIDHAESIDEWFGILLELVDKISGELRRRKQKQQSQSAEKIMEYIDENYCDSELSLKKISVVFGYNEHYISDMFRKRYGDKLSTIIEKRRIQKACELMNDHDLKINDIAKRVGYTSDVSFRRAFKKVMQITPSEYNALKIFEKSDQDNGDREL